MNVLVNMIRSAKRVYIIGNGGSYANAMHLCNDLLACGVKAYTLDSASLSAFANDFGWERAFAKWISVVGEPTDLLIAMSGSGQSENILAGIRTAELMSLQVYKIFGNERGEDMQAAEEMQLIIGHEVRACLQVKT